VVGELYMLHRLHFFPIGEKSLYYAQLYAVLLADTENPPRKSKKSSRDKSRNGS